ncbi:aryl-alcohol dehydrogenase [Dentipellis sp. KUC8613]|nr:aryl-alcohol dehydrogenase [Dentipellis sp. KUC8613]
MSASTSEMKKVPYVRLGNSGLKVSRLVLGCGAYGTPQWQPWVLDEEESIKIIKAAYDVGIQTFDSADVYSNGLSEVVLGKAIRQHNLPRDEIVVMTKVYRVVSREQALGFYNEHDKADKYGYVNQYGLSRKHIFAAVKRSLERLGLDYIDVLFCHRFDEHTPIAETMTALHDVVKAGYVRYIAMSSCWAWQFHVMQNYALAHNLTPFIAMTNQYSLLYREEEREMMPTLKHFGTGCLPWSPLARGLLTHPLNTESRRSNIDRFSVPLLQGNSKEVIERVEQLARRKGISMAQVSLAWLLHKDGVTAPVVGASSEAKLHDLLGALEVKLDAEDVAYLEGAYRPMPVIGHS